MKNPSIDPALVERVVEIVTREVLLALSESGTQPEAALCEESCAEGFCVQTCRNEVGRIVQAGASRISAGLGAQPADEAVASRIDHTLLKPEATSDQIAQLCYEARKYNFASVCVNPTHVRLAADLLRGSQVRVCTVIGFPLGATMPEVKSFEALDAIRDGASEIDMVVNIGALKARDYALVARDIQAVVAISHQHGAIVKVIIEAALLDDEEKITACLLSKEAGADFVKTSTGFGPGGATVEDVALMRRVVGPAMGVKAAGGIRSYQDAEQMMAAGATRIGASAGVRIVHEARGESQETSAGAKSGY